MTKLFLLLLGSSIVFLSGCTKQPEPVSDIPNPSVSTGTAVPTLRPTPESPLRPSHPILDAIVLPSWFQIDLFAEVPNARSLAVVETTDKLIVFVGNKDKSSIYAAIDNNKDFKAEEVKQLATKLNSPNGVAYREGTLYVAEIDRILAFRDILDHLDDPTYDVVYDDMPSDGHHGRKYIAFGPDGDLYVPIGAPCNSCDPSDPYAALRKIDLETKERTLVARGIRNTVGFTRHPQTEELRFTDNGRDRAGNDQPPDELNKITSDEQHFGYPFCHGGTMQDNEFTDRSCAEFVAPQVNLGPHVAALGLTFYTWTQYPETYRNKLFIAEHGSRNRTPPLGYRITLVDTTEKTYEIFAEGRLQGMKTLGRPVDVKQLNDGSLLISDDHAGLIYRIRYNG